MHTIYCIWNSKSNLLDYINFLSKCSELKRCSFFSAWFLFYRLVSIFLSKDFLRAVLMLVCKFN